MATKEYKIPQGTLVFPFDEEGIGKITLEGMDALMGLVPKWVPCSERMPKEGAEVLGTDKYGDIRHVIKDKCGDYEFATFEEFMHIVIVAWMPLPEPYKAQRPDYPWT